MPELGGPVVQVDLQNADDEGRVRLNTRGALDDLAALRPPVRDGDTLHLVDAELAVEGTALFSHEDGIWVALVDWDQVVDRS